MSEDEDIQNISYGNIKGQLDYQEKFSKSEIVGKKFRSFGGLYRIQKVERRTWHGQEEIWYHIRMIEPPHSIEAIPIGVFRKHCKNFSVEEVDRTEPIKFEFSSPSEVSLATRIKNRILRKKDYTCPECNFQSNDREEFTDMEEFFESNEYYCKDCLKKDDNKRKRYEMKKFSEGDISPSKMIGRRFEIKCHMGASATFDTKKVEEDRFLTDNIDLNRDGGHSFHDFWKDYEYGRIKMVEG